MVYTQDAVLKQDLLSPFLILSNTSGFPYHSYSVVSSFVFPLLQICSPLHSPSSTWTLSPLSFPNICSTPNSESALPWSPLLSEPLYLNLCILRYKPIWLLCFLLCLIVFTSYPLFYCIILSISCLPLVSNLCLTLVSNNCPKIIGHAC